MKGKTMTTTKTKYGQEVTREDIHFMDMSFDFFNCFANWFQVANVGQEIDAYYKDGEIKIEDIARFVLDNKDMTCNHGCNKPLLEDGKTVTFEVERDRFWDNKGSTSDAFILGELTFTRTGDNVSFSVKPINKSRR